MSCLGVHITVITELLDQLKQHNVGSRYDDPSLQQLREWIIIPQTQSTNLAYVDSLDKDKRAPATVHVVCPLQVKFCECVGVLQAFEDTHPNSFYYLNVLSVNHSEGAPSSAIIPHTKCKTLLTVLTPWDKPSVFHNDQCVDELYQGLKRLGKRAADEFHALLTNGAQSTCIDHIRSDPHCVLRALLQLCCPRDEVHVAAQPSCPRCLVGTHLCEQLRTRFIGLAQQQKDSDYDATEGAVGSHSLLYGSACVTLAMLHAKLGSLEAAQRLLQEANTLEQTHSGGNDEATLAQHLTLAHTLYLNGKYEAAQQLCDEAQKVIEQTSVQIHQRATLESIRGQVKEKLGDYAEAHEHNESAIALFQQHFTNDHPSTAIASCHLALVLSKLGNYQKAVQLASNALKILREHDHADVASAQNVLASILIHFPAASDLPAPSWDTAATLLDSALAVQCQMYGEHSWQAAQSYFHLGEVYQRQNQLPKALKYHRACLKSREQTLQPHHSDIGASNFAVAGVLMQLGRHKKAQLHMDQAVATFERVFDPQHPRTRASYRKQGELCIKLSEYKAADGSFRKLLASNMKHFGPNDPHVGESHLLLADTLAKQKLFRQAKDELEKAKACFLSLPKASVGILYGLGAVCMQQENFDEAAQHFTASLQLATKVELHDTHPLLVAASQGLTYCQIQRESIATSAQALTQASTSQVVDLLDLILLLNFFERGIPSATTTPLLRSATQPLTASHSGDGGLMQRSTPRSYSADMSLHELNLLHDARQHAAYPPMHSVQEHPPPYQETDLDPFVLMPQSTLTALTRKASSDTLHSEELHASLSSPSFSSATHVPSHSVTRGKAPTLAVDTAIQADTVQETVHVVQRATPVKSSADWARVTTGTERSDNVRSPQTASNPSGLPLSTAHRDVPISGVGDRMHVPPIGSDFCDSNSGRVSGCASCTGGCCQGFQNTREPRDVNGVSDGDEGTELLADLLLVRDGFDSTSLAIQDEKSNLALTSDSTHDKEQSIASSSEATSPLPVTYTNPTSVSLARRIRFGLVRALIVGLQLVEKISPYSCLSSIHYRSFNLMYTMKDTHNG
eukprot:m.364765 g.364765  ORF g.364765 m.364765 type:complete len:1081 (-) comp28447_c0_seq1:22-3264(-)